MTTHFWAVPTSKVRVIQIDIEPENLGRNYNLEVAIHGDAKVILERMTKLADSKKFSRENRMAFADNKITQ